MSLSASHIMGSRLMVVRRPLTKTVPRISSRCRRDLAFWRMGCFYPRPLDPIEPLLPQCPDLRFLAHPQSLGLGGWCSLAGLLGSWGGLGRSGWLSGAAAGWGGGRRFTEPQLDQPAKDFSVTS